VKISYKYAASLSVAVALFMAILDVTIVNVSLVAMMKDFGTTLSSIQWVITAYTLAQAAVIPISGYLANRFGIKRLFLAALAVFTVGSLLCGLSRDVASGGNAENLLIFFRVLQATGGGMLIPLGTAIAFSAFPPAERAASSAVISIPVLFAPALGPTIGGLIVDSRFEWPAIFYINVPIGIVALALVWRIVHPDERAPATGAARVGFDFPGLILSMVGVVLVIYAFVLVGATRGGSITPENPTGEINGWGYWLVWVLLVAGLACLALFTYFELKIARDPVLDLRLFHNRDFAVSAIVTWGTRAFIFGGFLLVPLFLQQYRGQSAVHTGLILSAQGIGAIVGIQIASRIYDLIGPRALVIAGMIVLVASTVWLTFVQTDSDASFFMPALFLRGIGFGWVGLPLQTIALAAITGPALPKASSLYNATAQIFTSIGVAMVTTLLVQRTDVHARELAETARAAGGALPTDLFLRAGTAAMSDVFWMLAAGTFIVGLAALLLPRLSLKQQQILAARREQQPEQPEARLAASGRSR
jgi:EmrB/QacA subfamily drug resistance transporter